MVLHNYVQQPSTLYPRCIACTTIKYFFNWWILLYLRPHLKICMFPIGRLTHWKSCQLKSFYLNFRVFLYFRNFGSVSYIFISVSAFYYNQKLLLIRWREWFCKHVFRLLLVETMASYKKRPRIDIKKFTVCSNVVVNVEPRPLILLEIVCMNMTTMKRGKICWMTCCKRLI